MRFTLRIWRQPGPDAAGRFVEYEMNGVDPATSFLEMLDALNEQLQARGDEPVAFDSDCREGVCGMCSMVIDGRAHGPQDGAATCQLYMRLFDDGSRITIEPFRAAAFGVLRDLVVDRGALDRILEAGGYISVHSGPKPEPNALPIDPEVAEEALDAALCIGCGACVASCPNGSASLFTAAKVSHLGLLPQGQPERYTRVRTMVEQMERESFGSCRNYGECEANCPKEISIKFIGQMNRDYLRAVLKEPLARRGRMGSQ